MKKAYSIAIEPQTITRQGLRNIEQFLTELSGIDGIEVSDNKLEFVCNSDMEEKVSLLLEKYSIVNLIGFFNDERH